jgi:hypothetical protein
MTEERLAPSGLLEEAGDSDFLRAVSEAAVVRLLMEADAEDWSASRYAILARIHPLSTRLNLCEPYTTMINAFGAAVISS